MCQKLASHRLQSGCGVQASGPQAATASYPASAVPDPYPLSIALGRSGRSGPPLCGGTPPQRPPCNATVCAPPQLTRQPPGSNATMCARFQLVVNAPRTRCGRRCASPIPPFEFRQFRQFPTTIHYPLHESPKRAILQGRVRTHPGWTRTRRIHTYARPPCPDRQPCRPAPNRTSQSCPKRTSLRALPVTTRNAQNRRPPRRPPTL